MAGFVDRVKIIFDVENSSATRNLKSLRADIAAAEGPIGKVKTAGKGMFDMLGVYGPQAAMAAGTALVAFGAQAVNAYNQAALAAGAFADATGLTTEDASRLIEVAGDLGVEVGTLQGAVQRVNLAANSGALEQFGVEIARTKDGAYDANQTFLNTIQAIGGIANAAEREAAARRVMGRSWSELAELTTMSAYELRDALGNVSDEKVFDDQDVAKAREFRQAMDDFKDSIEDISLAVGQYLTPVLSDVTGAIGGISDALGSGIGDKLGSWLDIGLNPLDEVASGVDKLFSSDSDWGDRFEGLGQSIPFVGEAVQRLTDDEDEAAEATNALADAADNYSIVAANSAVSTDYLSESLEDVESAADRAETKVSAFKDAVDELRGGTVGLEEANRQLQGEIDALTESVTENGATLDINTEAGRANREQIQANVDAIFGHAEAMIASGMSMDDAAAAADMLRAGLVDQMTQLGFTKDEAEAYIAQLGLTPENVTTAVEIAKDDVARGKLQKHLDKMGEIDPVVETEIQALIDEGKYGEARRRLDELKQAITTPLIVVPGGDIIYRPTGVGGDGFETKSLSTQAAGDRPQIMGANSLWQRALAAWGAARSGSASDTEVDKDVKKKRDFDRRMKRAAKRYEVGDYTPKDYLAALYRIKAEFGWERLSDPWMTVWREIQRIEQVIADAKREAEEEAIRQGAEAAEAAGQPWNFGTAQASADTMSTAMTAGGRSAGSRGGKGGRGGDVHIHLKGFFLGSEAEMRKAVRPLVPAIGKELDRWERGQ